MENMIKKINSPKEKTIIQKYFLLGNLFINGQPAMTFEINNILTDNTPALDFYYVSNKLYISI